MKIGRKSRIFATYHLCKLASAACLKRRPAPDGYSCAPILLINFGCKYKKKSWNLCRFAVIFKVF